MKENIRAEFEKFRTKESFNGTIFFSNLHQQFFQMENAAWRWRRAQINNRHAAFLIIQNLDDLLFVKSALLHRLLVESGIRLYSFFDQFAGLRSQHFQNVAYHDS